MHPTSRHRSRLVTGLLLAALALPLTACGDDEDASASPSSGQSSGQSSAPSSGPSNESPESGPTESDPTESDPTESGAPEEIVLTPPGTELAIDDPATVPLAFAKTRAVARLEILEVERLPATVLPRDLQPDEGPGGWHVNYVRLQATLLEGEGAGLLNLSAGLNIEGESEGFAVAPMILWEKYRPCYDAPPPYDHTGVPVGTTWKACVPILTRRSEPLDAILFTNPDNAYRTPLRWRM